MSGDLRVVTFGCRLNSYESELMQEQARAAGLDDAIIINTCAVTGEAERQARQAIRKARRENPNARIIVTGCAAQIDPARFAAMPEVDRVVGNAEKLRPATFSPAALDHSPRTTVSDLGTTLVSPDIAVSGFGGRARAFVQVQQGCDHRCTFCIIPFGRGPSRSLPFATILAQTRTLVAKGYRELVLSGVDLTSYGVELSERPTLGGLIERLLAEVPELTRLRVSSLDPAAIDDDLWRLIAEQPRLMPHLHLSAQAGDDMILKRMLRRHRRADLVAVCARMNALRPGIALGADLIAGFPTETEAMFANTLNLIADCGLVWLHVFPYSARVGTPAARMPQVAVPIRKERAARLRAAGAAALQRHLSAQIGTTVEALLERDGLGRTEHYAELLLPESVQQPLVRVLVTGVEGERLRGVPVAQR
ncbi:Threonylcarbamoyladenosine tRNA methylthiotransferase MtaB [uncultured Gammaproteobacteria bacterium]